MRGLCLMANGIAAGFSGNTVLFSGAYLPYAWPNANRLTTEDDVVAICPAGTSLVVGTKGYPYVMTGVSPSSITSQKLNIQQACISKRSMVSVDGVVLYASPDGLVGVTESGASVATDKIIVAHNAASKTLTVANNANIELATDIGTAFSVAGKNASSTVNLVVGDDTNASGAAITIETGILTFTGDYALSRPTRARGLKPRFPVG